jgi:hypothetical protein
MVWRVHFRVSTVKAILLEEDLTQELLHELVQILDSHLDLPTFSVPCRAHSIYSILKHSLVIFSTHTLNRCQQVMQIQICTENMSP